MVYEEKIPFKLGYLIIVMFLLISIIMLLFGWKQLTAGPIGSDPAPTWFYFLYGAFFLVLTWLVSQFRTLSIRIEEQTVILSYGMFHVLIRRDQIEKATLDTANPLFSYGGWGFRLGSYKGRPRKVLNIPGYKCVVITRKNITQEVVFSTAFPDDVIKLLSQ